MLWQTLFTGWFVTELAIAVLTRTRKAAKSSVQDRGTMPLLWAVISISITACEWLSHYLTPSFPNYCLPAALTILTGGLIIRWLAVLQLGKAFSANVAIQSQQRLYQDGLYRLVRHPSYSALLLIFFAIGLHSRNPVSLACAVLPPSVALLYRIHVEEIALLNAFGPDYQAYRRRTKRLMPWVY